MIEKCTFIPRNGAYHKELDRLADGGHQAISRRDDGFYIDGIGRIRFSDRVPVSGFFPTYRAEPRIISLALAFVGLK